MTRDTLFFLPPGFYDRGERQFCPECAELWGVLSWFPAIRESLEIVYVPIDKPRADMVDLLGEKNQNAPTLVMADNSPAFEDCGIMTMRGKRFINNARDIARYYAKRFGTPVPR